MSNAPAFHFDGPAGASHVLLFAHGAGAPMDHPWMSGVATGLAATGIRVARFEFPYMAGRRDGGPKRGPDRPAVLLECYRAAVEALRSEAAVIAIGGKSMGGRIATMIADDAGVAGTACFGYPFHPLGRPAQTRTAHLESMRTPTLILQGERDGMGTRADVDGYRLAPAIQLHWLVDGDHSLKPRRASGRSERDNLDEAVAAASAFILGLA
ncbi:MAG: dienelactone hydrolase family protein [Chloroflexi bacterium]|nr:dienelactone hydrolase family protein [Chloroflexota bacterium]